jgi:hypothetical protein
MLNVNGINYFSTTQVSVFGDVFLKATRESSNGNITFFTSTDGITYTQLGLTILGLSGAMATSTNQIIVCNQSVQSAILTKVYRATISNSIGGAPVVDFNPNQYNAANSQTHWVSTTGETWTINTGTATTGYKGHLCTKTIIQGDGVDDRLASGTLPTYQFITRYGSVLQYTMTGGVRILAGTGAAHLLYNFISGSIRAYNGIDLDFNNETINRLQLFTANYNSLTSTALLNNANISSGNTGTLTSLVLSILSNSTSGQFANAGITTIIQAKQVDSTVQNTAIYDYIRSINGNAF